MAASEKEGERKSDIAWVGQQWRMEGYCGRALVPQIPDSQPASDPAQVQQEQTEDGRTVAVVKTLPWQGKIARIGPPKSPAVANGDDESSAQATG